MNDEKIISGWIKLHRKIFNNPLYFSEPFTRSSAWIDLILLANHKENYIIKRGIKVILKRGQIGYSIDKLASRWTWSRGKVERFLKMLEIENQIERQNNNVTSLISIINYDDYQANELPNNNTNDTANEQPNDNANDIPNELANEQPNGHQTVKQTDTNKNVKKNKEEKKERNKEEINPKNDFSGQLEGNGISNSSKDYLSSLENAFREEYQKTRGFEYESVTIGKDRSALGKLAKQYREKHPAQSSVEAVQGIKSFFARCMKIEDKFIYENMSPMFIVSQMPKINSILKSKNGVIQNATGYNEEILSRII